MCLISVKGLVRAFALVLSLGAPLAAGADELDDIVAAGVLKVGIFEDFPPFASASADLSIQGYDIDVIAELAAALGVKAEQVAITGQNRIAYLTEHKVNLLVSIGYSDERAQVVAFTDPYAPYFIAVWGPKSIVAAAPADLAGKSVAVNRGTLEDTSLTEVAPADTDIQRFNDYNGVISALLAGQVDLIVVGNDVGASILRDHPDIEPELKFNLLDSPSNLAVNKGEDRLRQAINDAVVAMKADGRLNAISEKWLMLPLPAGL